MIAEKKNFIINAYTIDRMLVDYHWMIEAIKELVEENKSIDAPIASYGDEASLPKGNNISNPVYQEYLRREKRMQRIKEYAKKVTFIQSVSNIITEDRKAEVLYWLLEGKSMRWIGNQMGLSHTSIQSIKNNIIDTVLQNELQLAGGF
ncbi:helix-turn-helix transcriptional regulator [Viridibacillus arvi]|uniref:helix-turn-helix transcriptional regulator n=1 Tax=Viridibacillus arvi TaxID=263475 RepID=UPI0036D0EA21